MPDNPLKHQVDNTRKFFIYLCVFATLSVPRMLSLEKHWSSDESMWLRHSSQFMSSVKKGAFSETVIDYHPGVTTMWLAGLRTFFRQQGVNVVNLARARWFIGACVWVGISIASLLLYKLFGEWVALTGFLALAYSPLFLAQTRHVITDALAATFILLTVLLFLVYCQKRHFRYLILSGFVFGLALLSKSHALILVPWVLLCLFLYREKQKKRFWRHVAEGICFLNCAVLTVLALWPVFWTPLFFGMTLCLLGLTLLLFREMEKQRSPLWIVGIAVVGLLLVSIRITQRVWLVFDKVLWAVKTPHEVEHFFLGNVVNDPGWLFYPFVLMIKSTPLMLPFALIACLMLWKHKKLSDESRRHLLALVIGVLLFTVCLSGTSKKFSRYLLPAFLLLEILAAIGIIEVLKWSYAALRARFEAAATAKYKTTLAVIACVVFFLIQVMPVLARHPYYGTYYNLCWKTTDITEIITVGDASGLDIASGYLNQKSNAHQLRVQVSPLASEMVWYYFQGHTYSTYQHRDLHPDYEVVYIRDSQIRWVPQTGMLNGELESVISLNGIDHVWIYRIEKP